MKINFDKIKSVGISPFSLMLIIVIGVSAIFVYLAMYMYDKSGTAQLDLSRPEYASVRTKVNSKESTKPFEVKKNITADDLDRFEKRYQEASKQASEYHNSFAIDEIGDEKLGIEVKQNVESQ